MLTYRVGRGAAGSVVSIGVVYGATLGIGFARFGLDEPIVDPLLAVMEVLTIFSAAAILATMAVVYLHASDERKIFALLALAFTSLFAGTTSAVHFIELTARRQIDGGGIAWPSDAYAAELLAWDWFLGLALLAAAPVFTGEPADLGVRRGLWLCGGLTILGTAGPAVGDMRLQRIGIVGYAVVLPIVFYLLGRRFKQLEAGPGSVSRAPGGR